MLCRKAFLFTFFLHVLSTQLVVRTGSDWQQLRFVKEIDGSLSRDGKR